MRALYSYLFLLFFNSLIYFIFHFQKDINIYKKIIDSKLRFVNWAKRRNIVLQYVQIHYVKPFIFVTTVHKDVTERLERLNKSLFDEVRVVLDKNKAERHMRGGEATKQKYINIKGNWKAHIDKNLKLQKRRLESSFKPSLILFYTKYAFASQSFGVPSKEVISIRYLLARIAPNWQITLWPIVLPSYKRIRFLW